MRIITNTSGPEWIDLRQVRRWRMSWSEEVQGGDPEHPRYQEICGRLGHVWVHGRQKLVAFCKSQVVADRLETVPSAAFWRGSGVQGDPIREWEYKFDPADLDAVGEILKLRRRRRKMTPKEKAVAVERLAKYRFKPKNAVAETNFAQNSRSSLHLGGVAKSSEASEPAKIPKLRDSRQSGVNI